MATQQKWLKMNFAASDEEQMKEFVLKKKMRGDSLKTLLNDTFFCSEKLKLFNRAPGGIIEDLLVFYALREEFIKDRSTQTFEPAPEEKRVSQDFNFGRYLSICMGKILTDITNVHNYTWYFFTILTLTFYVIEICSNYDTQILAWVWVCVGYCFLIIERFHERNLVNTVKKFCGLEGTHILELFKAELKEEKKSKSSDVELNGETTLLVKDNEDSLHLPAWCHIDFMDYMRKRSWVKNLIIGEPKQNPQHALFYWEHYGPKSIRMYLQISQVFVGIYCALLLVVFFQIIREKYNLLGLLLFIIISIFPVFTMVRNQQRLVATVVKVSSFGSHRYHQAIATVCREEKTSHLVRTLFILYKFHRACQGKERRRDSFLHSKKGLSKSELVDFEKTFKTFDISGDNYVTHDDIKKMLSKIGLKHDLNASKNIIKVLDIDGDGQISRDEFLQWYADILHDEENDTNNGRAKFLFGMFDIDGDGYITLEEFKEGLDALDVGFTVDEIGEIVQEIDHEGNGVVSVDEFEYLLEKYYPKKKEI